MRAAIGDAWASASASDRAVASVSAANCRCVPQTAGADARLPQCFVNSLIQFPSSKNDYTARDRKPPLNTSRATGFLSAFDGCGCRPRAAAGSIGTDAEPSAADHGQHAHPAASRVEVPADLAHDVAPSRAVGSARTR